jgi:hypothetical protein
VPAATSIWPKAQTLRAKQTDDVVDNSQRQYQPCACGLQLMSKHVDVGTIGSRSPYGKKAILPIQYFLYQRDLLVAIQSQYLTLLELGKTFGRFEKDGEGYCFNNSYFNSPDAEVAYALVRRLQPRCVIEVGSGHNIKPFRAAIADGRMQTRLIAIDPHPRTAIESVADQVISSRLEDVAVGFFNDVLKAGDVLVHRLKSRGAHRE